MMNHPFFTLVVPIYNTKKEFLCKCIESILCNSFKDYEVILVNDCSTNEETLEIINRYKNLVNFSIINNKNNLGLGPSRNEGLKIARGKYIWFIDSDDWIYDFSMEKAYQYLKDELYDFMSINFDWSYKNFSERNVDYKTIVDNKYIWGGATVWSKIIKISFLRENEILHFNSKLFHEDEFFTPLLLFYAKKFVSCDDALYSYNKSNEDSITYLGNKWEDFLFYIDKWIENTDKKTPNNKTFLNDYFKNKISFLKKDSSIKNKSIFKLHKKVCIRLFNKYYDKNFKNYLMIFLLYISQNWVTLFFINSIFSWLSYKVNILKKILYSTYIKTNKKNIKIKYPNFYKEPTIKNKILFIEHVFKLDYIYNELDKNQYELFQKNFDNLSYDDLLFISQYETIIVSEELFDLIPLKKNHNIICLWHGNFALKRISSLIYKNYIAPFNKVVIGSKNKKEYVKYFKLNHDDIYPIGTIETAKLIERESNIVKKDIIEKLNISNKKIYFISFSFQEYPKFSANFFYNFEELEKELNEDEVILYNVHPSLYFFKTNNFYNTRKIIHVRNIPTIDLVSISDLVVTDYSSTFMYGIMFNKPILFLIESILGYDRGFNMIKRNFPSKVLSSRNPKKIIHFFREYSTYKIQNSKYKKIRENLITTNKNKLVSEIKKIIYNY